MESREPYNLMGLLLQVFCVPSPWTMAIMNVLAELHQEQELKLNLKFEIEVLCKTLGLDVNDLKPANFLRDPSRMALIEVQVSVVVGVGMGGCRSVSCHVLLYFIQRKMWVPHTNNKQQSKSVQYELIPQALFIKYIFCHVTTKQHCRYTTSVGIQTRYKKLVTHVESFVTRVQ